MERTSNNDGARTIKQGLNTRKRGHQHHNKFSGTRHSNVQADEILAALHSNDNEQFSHSKQTIGQPHQHRCDREEAISNTKPISADDSDNNNIGVVHSSILDRIPKTSKHLPENKCGDNRSTSDTLINDRNMNKSRRNNSSKTNLNAPINNDTTHDKEKIMLQQSNSSEKCADPRSPKDDADDSISSGSSSCNSNNLKMKKPKRPTTTRDGGGGGGDGGSRSAEKHRRSSKRKAYPANERPPLEGSDATNWNESNDNYPPDVENDPEAAEWSKLRCTSERMEVVAEREYRRQNRRCADYPGLAFGRSIFSSDTMMKLQLIRNELHNIMKSQLKRVGVINT